MSGLLQGKAYIPALSTDIRHTWAKFCPMWAERIKQPLQPLAITAVTTHHKPK